MPFHEDELDQMIGRPWVHRVPPECPQCGYNLTGLTSGVCPECGTPVQRRVVEQQARDIVAEGWRLKGINDIAKGALIIGVATTVMMLALWMMKYPGLARVIGFFGGVLALGLGLSILRATRVPIELLEELDGKPNYPLGIAAALLGAVLVALAVVLR